MQLAGYQLDIVHAGFLRLDGGAMFGIVPKALWERRIPSDDQNRIPLAMRCLLLRGHGRTILIDNGLGDKYTEKVGAIYGVDVEEHSLLESLAKLGVSPDDVTDVILTHLHFDHAGGSSMRNEAGELELVFKNATHHIQRSHWEWTKETPREHASFLPENIDPIGKSGKLNLLEGRETPFTNIEMIVVDGHTRGQQLPIIRGEEGTLLYGADLLPTTAHVPLLWVMAYDVEPLTTIEEKEAVLRKAANETWRVFFEHDPTIATASIVENERGFAIDDTRLGF